MWTAFSNPSERRKSPPIWKATPTSPGASPPFSDQRDLLRKALAPIADEPLPPQLNLSRIIENRRRRPSPVWWAVAAMLMLSIGGLGGWVMRGSLQASPGGLAALAQEAAYSYSVYAPDRVRPVEMRASDSAQLVQWVSNRLKQPVTLPDLTGSGYRLMGGRLIATSHGPAAMFMYDDDRGNRLVVLTRPMIIGAERADGAAFGRRRLGLCLGRWRDGLQPGRTGRSRIPQADRQRGPQAGAHDLGFRRLGVGQEDDGPDDQGRGHE